MLYKISATFNQDNLKEFYTKLTDGTIASQDPDGKEILASMKRAKIIDIGLISWYERCFCAIPLQHERTTVYDHYFETFTPVLVDEVNEDIEGKSFWEYMKKA